MLLGDAPGPTPVEMFAPDGEEESGMCVKASEERETGWRRGVVAAGVPAGERVTAGISDTRRLWPDAERPGEVAPREGEAAGTGSRSAAERSIGGWVTDGVAGAACAEDAITVIVLPSLIS